MTKTDQKIELELVITKEEACQIYAQSPEAVAFKLLELSKEIKSCEGSCHPPHLQLLQVKYRSTRSPLLLSPLKSGRKKGHKGAQRSSPVHINRQVKHTLDCCPDCGERLGKATRHRKRIIEDNPEVEPECTEHEIAGYWCITYKRIVESAATEAIPKASIGHRAVALTAWLHCGAGNTLSQILNVYNDYFRFKLTSGGGADSNVVSSSRRYFAIGTNK